MESPWSDLRKVCRDVARGHLDFTQAVITAFFVKPHLLGKTSDGWPARFHLLRKARP